MADSVIAASNDPSVELAARILFGDELLTELGPEFLLSITANPAAWAAALRSIWTISEASGTAVAGASRTVPQPDAGREQPAAAMVPVSEPGSAEVVLFDPTSSDAVESSGPTRDRPWRYDEVRAEFVALLEDATGYPAEVLDEDADLEADLAIDSVKQVEALGTLRERYQLLFDESFSIMDYRSIRAIATHLTERLNRERLTAVSA